jgi:hypothetical protein
MVATDEQILDVVERCGLLDASAMARARTGRCRAGARRPANGPRRTWTWRSTLRRGAKMPMPLAGLVDQLVKNLNQERMNALVS